MRRLALAVLLAASVPAAFAAAPIPSIRVPAELKPGPDLAIDAEATAKIRQYTTAPEFNSPLTE